MKTIEVPERVEGLHPPLPDNTWVGIDTELFGLQEPLHRPTSGSLACLTICSDPGTVYAVTNPNDVQSALDRVKNCVWVMQNAKFDITHLRRWAFIPPRDKIWDTMLIERILYGGYYDTFGLNHLARRHLDIYLEKETRDLFEKATEMTDEMWKYSIIDPVVTLMIAEEQKKVITKSEFQVWKECDRPTLWAVLDMPGFRVAEDEWLELAERNKKRADEIEENLPVNPRSYVKVKELLRNKGFKGLKSTGQEVLEKAINKYPNTEAAGLAEQILLARKYSKAYSTYGKSFIDECEYESDNVLVINGDWNVTAAETGRMSCSGKLQTIPSRETSEYRECFIPRPGNKIVVIDYSQQEPCISAYLTQDKKFIDIINSGKDIYITVGWEVFKEHFTKADKRRKQMKSLVLGTSYGLSPYGLARRENLELDEAEALINVFFSIFPGYARWARKQMKQMNYTETVMGRKSWLNPYSGQHERNALNSPIQGTAGDMTKKSKGRIFYEWEWDYPYACVNVVHDELVFDVPEKLALPIAKWAQNIMVNVGEEMCKGIKFRAEYGIGESWAAKE